MDTNKAATEKASAAPLKVNANGSNSTSGGVLYTSGHVLSGNMFILCLHWEDSKRNMDNVRTSVGAWDGISEMSVFTCLQLPRFQEGTCIDTDLGTHSALNIW